MKYWALLITVCICFGSMASEALNKEAIVNSLAETIEANYVLTNKIAPINAQLAELANSNELDGLTNSDELAVFLTKKLKAFDKHFAVQLKTSNQGQSPAKESWFTKLQRSNSGFNKVQILSGNVGYFDFWGFDALTDKSRDTVKSVMQLVSNTDALIIDLRHNGGGSAEMVQLLSSYFLPKKTLLNSFYSRKTGATTEFWTLDDIEQIFADDFPVYILISGNTFSAAEEFSYNFKQLKRATIIGEPSKGGANPWQWFELGFGYRAAIPVSMAVNPITKTNWEAIGVIPDIKTTSENAQTQAYIQALKLLSTRKLNQFQLKEINDELNKLNHDSPP